MDDIARGIYEGFAQYRNKYDKSISVPYRAAATVDSTLQAFSANAQGLVGDIRSELRLMLGQPLRDITVVKTPFTREFIIATQSGEPVASLRCLQNDEGYDYFVADVCLLEELPEIA